MFCPADWLVFLHTPYSFGSDEEVIPVATGFLTEYQVNPVVGAIVGR